MAQADVVLQERVPTVTEVKLPREESRAQLLDFGIQLRVALRDLDANRGTIDPDTYRMISFQLAEALEEAGEMVVADAFARPRYSVQVTGSETFSWIRGCRNPPTRVIPSIEDTSAYRELYRAAIARKQKAAVRAIKTGNIHHLRSLVEDIVTIYEIVGDVETATLLRTAYCEFLISSLVIV